MPKSRFSLGKRTASHRLLFEGGCEANCLLRCFEHAKLVAAQPFRVTHEAPEWALCEDALRAAAARSQWTRRCGGAVDQLEMTVFAARNLRCDGNTRRAFLFLLFEIRKQV